MMEQKQRRDTVCPAVAQSRMYYLFNVVGFAQKLHLFPVCVLFLFTAYLLN